MTPPRWAILMIALAVVGFVVLEVLSVGKPADRVELMAFSPRYATVHRTYIQPGRHPAAPLLSLRRSGRREYPARSLTLTSNGAPCQAWLLDLSDFDDSRQHVEAFMQATKEIDEGREPTAAAIAAKAVDVTEARFELSPGMTMPLFGNRGTTCMLVVACDGEAEVTVRVSYR
jgi:hypothetical protein